MTSPTKPAELAWLDLLPPEYLPDGLPDLIAAEVSQRGLVAARNASVATASTRLSGLAGDPRATEKALRMAALDVLAAREALAHTPQPVAVDPGYAAEIVTSLGDWFRRRPAVLGVPPLILSELRHFEEYAHPGEQRPRATDAEDEAVRLFGEVAREVFHVNQTVGVLLSPCGVAELPERVRSWAAFAPQYEEHVALVAKVREVVDRLDEARLASPDLHVCRLMGGRCGPLMAVETHSTPWTVEAALNKANGRPVGPVLAGAA